MLFACSSYIANVLFSKFLLTEYLRPSSNSYSIVPAYIRAVHGLYCFAGGKKPSLDLRPPFSPKSIALIKACNVDFPDSLQPYITFIPGPNTKDLFSSRPKPFTSSLFIFIRFTTLINYKTQDISTFPVSSASRPK